MLVRRSILAPARVATTIGCALAVVLDVEAALSQNAVDSTAALRIEDNAAAEEFFGPLNVNEVYKTPIRAARLRRTLQILESWRRQSLVCDIHLNPATGDLLYLVPCPEASKLAGRSEYPEAAVSLFLRAYGEAWGITRPGEQLVPVSHRYDLPPYPSGRIYRPTDPDTLQIEYDQFAHGVPVLGSEMIFVMKREGALYHVQAVHTNFHADVEPLREILIRREAAIEIARRRWTKAMPPIPVNASLVILPGLGYGSPDYSVLWVVTLAEQPPDADGFLWPPGQDVFVDATTGRVHEPSW